MNTCWVMSFSLTYQKSVGILEFGSYSRLALPLFPITFKLWLEYQGCGRTFVPTTRELSAPWVCQTLVRTKTSQLSLLKNSRDRTTQNYFFGYLLFRSASVIQKLLRTTFPSYRPELRNNGHRKEEICTYSISYIDVFIATLPAWWTFTFRT